MQKNAAYEYTRIRDNIWQLAEDAGVYCTLIRGTQMAMLIDTGYGKRDLRTFVEQHVTTPYMVVNSHGHPDHIGGNHWFDTVWAAREEWDIIDYFEEGPRDYERKEMEIGSEISLGNIHVDIIDLSGHTKGSIGFLIREEGILVAGDAMNEELWLFNYGSLSMQQLYDTLKRVNHIKFDSYICGHSNQEYKKEKLCTHIRNIEILQIEKCVKRDTIGFETYCSEYQDSDGRSVIVFSDKNYRRDPA